MKWNAVSSRQRSYRYCCMDALLGRWLNGWRRSWTAITQEFCEQYWTSPGGNTPQNTNYTATYIPSRKLSKSDELDMHDTAGEAGTSSLVMYSHGPPHMAEQKQDDLLEHIYSSYVRIRDIALKTCRRPMNDREKWRERVRDIRACGTSWWCWWYISSSSCRAASTDILDHLSPLFPIVHRLRQVFWVTSCVLT